DKFYYPAGVRSMVVSDSCVCPYRKSVKGFRQGGRSLNTGAKRTEFYAIGGSLPRIGETLRTLSRCPRTYLSKFDVLRIIAMTGADTGVGTNFISGLGQCYCNMTFPKYSSG